jgi:hypothetical protein
VSQPHTGTRCRRRCRAPPPGSCFPCTSISSKPPRYRRAFRFLGPLRAPGPPCSTCCRVRPCDHGRAVLSIAPTWPFFSPRFNSAACRAKSRQSRHDFQPVLLFWKAIGGTRLHQPSFGMTISHAREWRARFACARSPSNPMKCPAQFLARGERNRRRFRSATR